MTEPKSTLTISNGVTRIGIPAVIITEQTEDSDYIVAEFYTDKRETNARLFTHANELVKAMKVVVADSRWISGEPNFERLRAILAKIDGSEK